MKTLSDIENTIIRRLAIIILAPISLLILIISLSFLSLLQFISSLFISVRDALYYSLRDSVLYESVKLISNVIKYMKRAW